MRTDTAFQLLGLLASATAMIWASEGRPDDTPALRRSRTSIDARLQKRVEHLFQAARLPYGAFVALDPATGQVLSLVSHGRGVAGNLALRSSFPAASVFKIVTAAAALEGGKLRNDSLIPVRGGYHTLYRRNVLAGGGLDPSMRPRSSSLITLEDALAHSVNSVFGKLGVFGIGGDGLRRVARRFGFGTSIPFELPVENDHVEVPDDEFGLAEAASGFTRKNTLSPLHGALIAAAISNDGLMMQPSIVKGHRPRALSFVVERGAANDLALMMHRTIISGTSSRAFRRLDRSEALSDVFIAGKTGTLSGWNPKGIYDWFVGFAEKDGRKLAIAVMSVHGSRSGVKSSLIARAAFESYFGPNKKMKPVLSRFAVIVDSR